MDERWLTVDGLQISGCKQRDGLKWIKQRDMPGYRSGGAAGKSDKPGIEQ